MVMDVCKNPEFMMSAFQKMPDPENPSNYNEWEPYQPAQPHHQKCTVLRLADAGDLHLWLQGFV